MACAARRPDFTTTHNTKDIGGAAKRSPPFPFPFRPRSVVPAVCRLLLHQLAAQTIHDFPLSHFTNLHNIGLAITCLRDRCGVHAVHSRDATAMCTSLCGCFSGGVGPVLVRRSGDAHEAGRAAEEVPCCGTGVQPQTADGGNCRRQFAGMRKNHTWRALRAAPISQQRTTQRTASGLLLLPSAVCCYRTGVRIRLDFRP